MCLCACFIPSSCHPKCVLECSLSVSSCLSFSCFSPSFTSCLPHSTCTLPSTQSPMSTTPREITAALSHNEEYCPIAKNHPPTGLEGAKRSKTSSDDSNSMRGTVRTRNGDEIRGETKKQKIRCLNLLSRRCWQASRELPGSRSYKQSTTERDTASFEGTSTRRHEVLR